MVTPAEKALKKAIVALALAGRTTVEIASATGRPLWYIQAIERSPLFQVELQRLKSNNVSPTQTPPSAA